MKGKRGLIMGVANDHSIAWGIAKKLSEQGAELAFTYQGEAFGRRVKPLADKLGAVAGAALRCRGQRLGRQRCSTTLAAAWGGLDFVVHAIGFSDKNELKGLYADTSRENFIRTMVISCYSFTEVARKAAALMDERRRDATLTYAGSVAGHAKLQCDGRGQGRPGGKRALPGQRLRPARHPRQRASRPARCAPWQAPAFPMHGRCSPTSSAIRRCAARSPSTMSAARRSICCPTSRRASPGEIHYVDSGYHIVSMPTLDELKRTDDEGE